MDIAKGGKIEQAIRIDNYLPSHWNPKHTMAFNVQLLNASVFERVTGLAPPETPVNAKIYAAAGLPFFDMYEEQSNVSGDFGKVKSTGQIDKIEDNTIKARRVTIDSPRRQATPAYEKLKTMVDDPDGLLDPVGPLREISTVTELRSDIQ